MIRTGEAGARTRERIGGTKREGGIIVVSLSRRVGQGRRGVTQDGSKWVFRPAGNDSPENWPDPRICVAHICGDTDTRACPMCHNISARPAGIYDNGLFHKTEIRDGLTRSDHALARSVTRNDIGLLCISNHSFCSLLWFLLERGWECFRVADDIYSNHIIISLCAAHYHATNLSGQITCYSLINSKIVTRFRENRRMHNKLRSAEPPKGWHNVPATSISDLADVG